MKLGLGLYRSLLNDRNFAFARQCGATHLVVQLVDYVQGGSNPSLSRNYLDGWGITRNQRKYWELDELKALKRQINSHGLVWAAIENFDPSHWYDILLDGPEKHRQMDQLKRMIANIGKAGIPVMGYYFSLAGVWGWRSGPDGRGGAVTVGYQAGAVDIGKPIPRGMVWNMVYDPDAPAGTVPPVSAEEMWERLAWFLAELLPVAAENGVTLAAHPDDPPLPVMRGTARLFSSIPAYRRLLSLSDHPANGFECCLGTLQEMETGDLYAFLSEQAAAGRIGYVHFRNVVGKVPDYREAFVDEGDIDMIRVLRILREHRYEGVLIPDHTPELSCDAPWHAGMAFALGYMRGALHALEREG